MQQNYSQKNNLFVTEYDSFYKEEPEPVEGKKKKKAKEEEEKVRLNHTYDLPPCGKIQKRNKENFESIFDVQDNVISLSYFHQPGVSAITAG